MWSNNLASYFGATMVFVGLCLYPSTASAADKKFGYFANSVKVQFVEGGKGGGRAMRLLSDFSYVDPHGKIWTAKKGYETDGASIPKIFWSIIGGPFEGGYRRAAIIHDWYCDRKNRPWPDVHRVFYYATRATGLSTFKAKLLYLAVRIGGPKWGKKKSNCQSMCHAMTSLRPTYKPDKNGVMTNYPSVTKKDLAQLSDWVKKTDPNLKQMDKYVLEKFPESTFGH